MVYGIEVAAFVLGSVLLSFFFWHRVRVKELEEEVQKLQLELEAIKAVSIKEVEMPEKKVVKLEVKER